MRIWHLIRPDRTKGRTPDCRFLSTARTQNVGGATGEAKRFRLKSREKKGKGGDVDPTRRRETPLRTS